MLSSSSSYSVLPSTRTSFFYIYSVYTLFSKYNEDIYATPLIVNTRDVEPTSILLSYTVRALSRNRLVASRANSENQMKLIKGILLVFKNVSSLNIRNVIYYYSHRQILYKDFFLKLSRDSTFSF